MSIWVWVEICPTPGGGPSDRSSQLFADTKQLPDFRRGRHNLMSRQRSEDIRHHVALWRFAVYECLGRGRKHPDKRRCRRVLCVLELSADRRERRDQRYLRTREGLGSSTMTPEGGDSSSVPIVSAQHGPVPRKPNPGEVLGRTLSNANFLHIIMINCFKDWLRGGSK